VKRSLNTTQNLTETFRLEAADLLVELEAGLLEMETGSTDQELVGRVFRALHTLKGSGAMFGFDGIVTVAHALETAFAAVRSGRAAVTPTLVALSLQGKDLIQILLQTRIESDPALLHAARQLVDAALAMVPGAEPAASPQASPPSSPPASPPASSPSPAPAPRTSIFRIRFRPQPGLFEDGTNAVALWNDVRALGRCEVVAHTSAIPPLTEMDPERCYLSWDAVLSTEASENAVRDVFIFVEDRGELRIELVDDGKHHQDEVSYKQIGELLVERGDVSTDQLETALASRPRIGDVLEEQAHIAPEAAEAAAIEQRMVREARTSRTAVAAPAGASVRVGAEKLDNLVDLVGELVIAQARLAALAARRDDLELSAVSENIDRLSADLRDNALNLRMVPIGTTFSRFRRLVHDLATSLGKNIDLQTEGAETELDKTVIERLGDPLVHLIRNSCDHGIETPEERRQAGKPGTGQVRLAAYQSGPSVVIEIHDDGRGLHAPSIRAQAVTRGQIAADAELSEQEIFQLAFLPGLSTAEEVSSVSGRGVGMDVVKRSIDALRGAVHIESVRGAGSTVRIRLPLTLAIIDGLLVAVGAGRYVLPMSMVEECVEITRADIERAHGSHLAAVRGELVPYLRLREWFGETGDRPAVEQIAIAHAEGMRFGFAVDDVIGQHQTVIKGLGRMYRDVDGLSGATILGDGTVALIIDVAGVIRAATSMARPSLTGVDRE
jgi:two-component system chemotaxis sensor kinase CheA